MRAPSSWFTFACFSVAFVSVLAAQADDDWLSRCERWGRRERPKHCEIREMGLRAPRGTITVDGGQNGGVTVRAWDRDSIHVQAKVQTNGHSLTEARELADRITIRMRALTIRADGPSEHDFSWSVSYDVWVPRQSDLTLSATNGPVAVEGVSGRMSLDAENGPVSLIAVGGDVRARATNGPLHIELEGSRWEGAGLDAETLNGPVDLAIPRDYSARLETGTLNGPFNSRSPLNITIQGRMRMSRITSVLGSGGATVRAVTTNGPVEIRRN